MHAPHKGKMGADDWLLRGKARVILESERTQFDSQLFAH